MNGINYKVTEANRTIPPEVLVPGTTQVADTQSTNEMTDAVAQAIDLQGGNPNQQTGQQELDLPSVRLSDPTVFSVLASLREILMNGSVAATKARGEMNVALATQRATTYADALSAIQLAKANYEACLSDLDQKTNELKDADGELSVSQARLNAAQNQYNKSQVALDECAQALRLMPDDPDVQAKFALLKAQADEATTARNEAQTQYDNALQVRNAAAGAAFDAGEAAIRAQGEVTTCLEDLTRLADQTNSLDPQLDLNESVKSLKLMLQQFMLRLSELMEKASTDKLNNDLKLYRERQEQLQEEFEKKSQEYQDAVRKAEEQQKKMKLVSKIVSWTITGLSCAMAAMSGGALLALVPAVAALAVAVTDEVLDQKGEQTLSSMAMDPIMDAMTTGFVKAIQALPGETSEETAEIAAMVLTAITMTAASIAGAKLAGSGSKLVGSGVSALADKSIAFKNMVDGLSKFRLFSPRHAAVMAKAVDAMRFTSRVGQTANAGFQGGMGVISAKSKQDAQYVQAEMTDTQAFQDIVKKILDEVVDAFCKSSAAKSWLVNLESEWQQQSIQLNRQIIRHA